MINDFNEAGNRYLNQSTLTNTLEPNEVQSNFELMLQSLGFYRLTLIVEFFASQLCLHINILLNHIERFFVSSETFHMQMKIDYILRGIVAYRSNKVDVILVHIHIHTHANDHKVTSISTTARDSSKIVEMRRGKLPFVFGSLVCGCI